MMLRRNKRRRAGPYNRRSSRFALGLLVYLVLTIVVFNLVWRYTPRLADRIGGIENGWLQFGIYFVVYIVLTLAGVMAGRRVPLRLRREALLRLIFAGGATLSFVVAVYQARFGTGLSATYFSVGILGTFTGALIATQHYFGLIELNSPPAPEVMAEVMHAHERVALADTPWDHVKRLLEMLLSLALIVLSLPISVMLAMAIWLQDPGPLLHAKVVVTRGGRSFRQLKLRSMIKDAEQATGAIPAALDDQRITPFGQALRRTHIDELPQMINIALGQMSLVGPRPERTIFVRRHIRTMPRYASRHAVRPGLAGMAQVYGDYYSTPREKLRYDLLYIRRRSFGLDLSLLLTATMIGLVGIWPGMNRGRRLFTIRRQEERWQRAYEALHGAPPVLPRSERLPSGSERTMASERISDVQDHTPAG